MRFLYRESTVAIARVYISKPLPELALQLDSGDMLGFHLQGVLYGCIGGNILTVFLISKLISIVWEGTNSIEI